MSTEYVHMHTITGGSRHWAGRPQRTFGQLVLDPWSKAPDSTAFCIMSDSVVLEGQRGRAVLPATASNR